VTSVILEDNSPVISNSSPGLICGEESSASMISKPNTGDPIIVRSFVASQSQNSINVDSFTNLDDSKELKVNLAKAEFSPKKKYKEIRGIKLRFGPKHISKILSTKKCIF
jgi:hypothetical protein